MKRTIKALSYTQVVYDWLEHTRHPRILHIFDAVCNLISERKEILSVVTSRIGDGPFNLVIGNGVLFSEQFNIETAISIHDNQLQIGVLAIDISNANLWNPHPGWKRLHGKRDEILNRLSSIEISRYRSAIPAPLLSSLTTSMVSADISSTIDVAKKLAGLGIGLTPSGDDIIVGALYAAWIIHPLEIASVLARGIAETTAPLTTSLSAAWIRSAGRGEAGILWHKFFNALVLNDAKLTNSAMGSILSVGETSGFEALLGFTQVMFDYKRRIIDECPS